MFKPPCATAEAEAPLYECTLNLEVFTPAPFREPLIQWPIRWDITGLCG